jgi:hypothetical protein
MRDLDELSRRCKIYYLKRVIKYLLSPLILIFFIGWIGFEVIDSSKESKKVDVVQKRVVKENRSVENNGTKHINKEKRVEKKSSTTYKKNRITRGVKVIQFIASSKRYNRNLEKDKRKFEQMGFSCYIKDDNDGFIKLRCLIPENFKEVGKILKNRGIDFFLPIEDKEYLERLNLKRSNISNLYISKPKFKDKEINREVKRERKSTFTINNSADSSISNRDRGSSLIASKKATVDELIEQYNNRPDFTRAIMIARAYYKKGDFKNSAKWAKKANSINHEREEGWILYAKSAYALGQKKRAIKILKVYLNFKSSEKARKLLMKFNKD